MRYLLTLLIVFPLWGPGGALTAQRVLLFEKLTASRSDRIYEGDGLRFKLKGDKFWQQGYIREMRADIQALVINDRYVMLDEIAVVHRGNTIAGKLGYGLITFGAGWSVWAALGYTLDDDDTSNYSAGDAAVTLTSAAAGFALIKILGNRRFRTGKYKRLRVVDLDY